MLHYFCVLCGSFKEFSVNDLNVSMLVSSSGLYPLPAPKPLAKFNSFYFLFLLLFSLLPESVTMGKNVLSKSQYQRVGKFQTE